MAFSIKDPEADRLARELAARTGEGLTEAVIRRPARTTRADEAPNARWAVEATIADRSRVHRSARLGWAFR